MALIYKASEEKLVEQLGSMRKHSHSWKLAILSSFKAKGKNYVRQLKTKNVVDKLNQISIECNCTIFICEDGDVIFLFSDSRRNMLPKLIVLLQELMPGISPEHINFESAFRIMDLGVDYEAAMELAYAKSDFSHEAQMTANLHAQNAIIPEWDNLIFIEAVQRRAQREKYIIMVIDDDENIRMLVRSILRPKYDVVSAQEATSGLELYNNIAPDLLLLDINMPGMDGIELLERIVKIDNNSLVLMLSSNSTVDKVKKAIEIGAKGFITKPFTPNTLLNYITKNLENGGSAHE